MHSQAFSSELHIQLEGIRSWLNIRAHELGFDQLRISDTDVSEAVPKLASWLAEGRHGEMGYMERHASLRAQPDQLQAGAIRSICVTMPYLPQNSSKTTEEQFSAELARLEQPQEAVISLYARGRDYHKILRAKLQILATELEEKVKHLARIPQAIKSQDYDLVIAPNIREDSSFTLIELDEVLKSADVLAGLVKHRLFVAAEKIEKFVRGGTIDFCGLGNQSLFIGNP